MEKNIILAGVGGQGILSIAFVIDHAAMDAGFEFKQAEVHGMAQRGGVVESAVVCGDDPGPRPADRDGLRERCRRVLVELVTATGGRGPARPARAR